MELALPNHPQHVLLFALEGQPDDDASDDMLELVEELKGVRTWSVSPPEFVDEVDEESVGEPGEEPLRTVGFFVNLQSGFPSSGDRIPIAIDRAQYEDVKVLVEQVSLFSVIFQEDVIVEFAGEAVGWIECGVPDAGLTETFLEEWRKSIETRESEEQ